MKDKNDQPPPIPEEALKKSSVKIPGIDLENWSPPSNIKPEVYEFFFINKETKLVAHRGFNRDNFERYKSMYPEENYLSFECVDKEIINVTDKIKKRYSKLIEKVYSEKHDPDLFKASSEMCYQLYAGMKHKQEKNSKN